MAFLPYPRRPLKSSHRIHRIHGSFWRGIFSHRFHRCSQIFRLRCCLLICVHPCLSVGDFLRQTVLCVPRVLWEHSFCLLCWCCRGSCTSVVVFSHGFPQMVRLRYWWRGYGRMPYPPNLCASVSICGRLSSPDGSVCSACSVGTLSLFALLVLQRQLHQRGSILPRISRISTEVRLRCWRRGYGRMPYPPNLCLSVGGFLCQKVLCVPRILWDTLSVCFVGASVGGTSPPVSVRRPIGFRPPSNQIPSAAQSDSVRRPIRYRPPPDRIPSAVRSDCVRHPIRFRPLHDAISSVCILRRLRCNTQCVYVLHPFMFAKLRNKFDF